MESVILWHPESPGMRVVAVRSWWQRILYPKDFATIGETLRYYMFMEKRKDL